MVDLGDYRRIGSYYLRIGSSCFMGSSFLETDFLTESSFFNGSYLGRGSSFLEGGWAKLRTDGSLFVGSYLVSCGTNFEDWLLALK